MSRIAVFTSLVLVFLTFASATQAMDQMNQIGVAHSPATNTYLVVKQTSNGRIECFPVSALGTTPGATIELSSALCYHPAIAYDSDLGRFLAVWSEEISGPSAVTYTIKARLLGPSGGAMGPLMTIADQLPDKPGQRITYSANSKRYLVVFSDASAVRAQFLKADGSPDGAAFDAIPADSHTGFSRALSPSLSYDGVNHRFLVLGITHGMGAPPMSIYGAIVDDGTPGTLYKAPFPVLDSTTFLYPPSAAFDSANQRFLATWEVYTGSGHELWGQLINADGSLSGANWKIEPNRSVSFANHVAWKEGDGRYLVTWIDERDQKYRVFARELNADGTDYGANFVIADRAYQYNLLLTYNPVSDNTLVAYGAADFNGFVVTPEQAVADLVVLKHATEQALPGQPLTYWVTVHNLGPDTAKGVVVTDLLPDFATFISAVSSQGTCVFENGDVTCDIGTMANDATVTVTIKISPAKTGVFTNAASVTSDALDPYSPNDKASADAIVRERLMADPMRGTIGTEIEITGSNLGSKKGKVQLVGPTGKKALKILSWNEGGNDVIRALIRRAPPVGTYALHVKPKEPEGAAEIIEVNAFEIAAPEITASPGSAAPNDTVTVTGKTFGTKKRKVYIEYLKGQKTKRKSCKVLSWPSSSATGTGRGDIQFRLPKKFTPGNWKLIVSNKVGEDAVPFTVR